MPAGKTMRTSVQKSWTAMVNLQSNTLENNHDRHLTLQQRGAIGPPDPDPPVRGAAGPSAASPLSTQVD
jgi:hypothetical protein